jgi:hypothetical protein
MKLFAIALGVVCGVAAVLFVVGLLVLSAVLEHPDAMAAAKVLAGVPILTFPKFLEFLEQQEGRKNLAAGKQTLIYDFRGFQIAWPLMALYGGLLLLAVNLLSWLPVTGMLEAGFAEDIKESARGTYELALILAIVFPATILCAYFVGRWIGTRCSSRGVAAILLAAIFYAAVSLALGGIVPDEPWEPSSKLLELILLAWLICFGLIGYWRGRKYRLPKYLHYLLGVLPAETRDTVIGLAFEEAQRRIASAAGSATGRK